MPSCMCVCVCVCVCVCMCVCVCVCVCVSKKYKKMLQVGRVAKAFTDVIVNEKPSV